MVEVSVEVAVAAEASPPPVLESAAAAEVEQLEALGEGPDAAIEPSEPVEASGQKRKLVEPEAPDGEEAPVDEEEAVGADAAAAAAAADDGAKRQRVDGEAEADRLAVDGDDEVQKLETTTVICKGQDSSMENTQHTSEENIQNSTAMASQEGSVLSGQQPGSELATVSRKIEVPNNKVGVLIGKAGDTIKFLQFNSRARIQITRDAEADQNSSTRPVELIGTLESINKAEQLIKDVIAEADAGGSPSLVARGFGTTQSGAEQLELQVPNEKVGMIIGKGGETIKNLQMRSGARIQLITQNLSEGDPSREKTIRISGSKKQIESARVMIKEVMNQAPTRPSPLSGGHSHQPFRPHGPSTLPQCGPRAPPPTQFAAGYDNQQRGMHPPQSTHYPSQPPSGYSQQPPSRGSFGSGWDQRSAAPAQPPLQTGGYDYYGQGGQAIHVQSSNHLPGSAPASNPLVNYNYGQSQDPNYGQPAPYGQSIPTQQSYGYGYDQPKYENHSSSQQFYGQQPVSSQPGVYGQQMNATQPGYAQQQSYSNPAYGGVQGAPKSYGPQGASQQGDLMYQGSAPSAYESSYGPRGPTQQSYPYGSSTQSQPAPAYGQSYGPTSGTADGYTQSLAGYGQGGQPVANYTQQGPQSGNYGQYPSQPGYGGQPVSNNASYGYQGGSGAEGYSNSMPSSGYGNAAPVSSQAGYAPSNPSGYDQSMPAQTGYGAHPGSAPVGYT